MSKTKRHRSDADYADMAASYGAEPPTVDEVVSIEVSPAVLRMGRPAKGATATGKTPVLAIRLPEALRAELTRRAKARGSSASELIRLALIEYLDRHPPRGN
jgi:hypothetical protein